MPCLIGYTLCKLILFNFIQAFNHKTLVSLMQTVAQISSRQDRQQERSVVQPAFTPHPPSDWFGHLQCEGWWGGQIWTVELERLFSSSQPGLISSPCHFPSCPPLQNAVMASMLRVTCHHQSTRWQNHIVVVSPNSTEIWLMRLGRFLSGVQSATQSADFQHTSKNVLQSV